MPPRLPKVPHSFHPSHMISLTQPFTPNSLEYIREILVSKMSSISSISTSTDIPDTGDAAVLIPFCNVAGKPGILFELRARTLRSHSGEVSFPGGKRDESDASLCDAALRETLEELGIQPNQIEILGRLGPPELNLRRNLRVWPFVGFVHEENRQDHSQSPDQSWPSIDIESIRRNASPAEVETVFHLPLTALVASSRKRSDLFRGERQYWAINATDFISSGIKTSAVSVDEKYMQVEEVGVGKGGNVEVWGLTGWYLSLLMKTLRVYQ
ncbi:NUDIX hydrolase domain-like protein [Cyathus striatus]|nr:NUDIX hydrolase domain-like protein [Cyathus striatus]